MSAELVDPFATPRERLKISDMCSDITARLMHAPYNDPALCPQLVAKTLHELRRAAEAGSVVELDLWARALLEQLHHRAVSGVAYSDEPQEPADSLDSDPRHIGQRAQQRATAENDGGS